jgi:hypothetical protein
MRSKFEKEDLERLVDTCEIPSRLRSWGKYLWALPKQDTYQHTEGIADSEYWTNILSTPAVILHLEDLAVTLQAKNQSDCGRCSSIGLKRILVVVATCPCCEEERITRLFYYQLIVIGARQVRGKDIGFVIRGLELPWWLCNNPSTCWNPPYTRLCY